MEIDSNEGIPVNEVIQGDEGIQSNVVNAINEGIIETPQQPAAKRARRSPRSAVPAVQPIQPIQVNPPPSTEAVIDMMGKMAEVGDDPMTE